MFKCKDKNLDSEELFLRASYTTSVQSSVSLVFLGGLAKVKFLMFILDSLFSKPVFFYVFLCCP